MYSLSLLISNAEYFCKYMGFCDALVHTWSSGWSRWSAPGPLAGPRLVLSRESAPKRIKAMAAAASKEVDWMAAVKTLSEQAPGHALFKGTSVAGKSAAAAVCAVAALFMEADGWAFVTNTQLAKDVYEAASPIVTLWTQGDLNQALLKKGIKIVAEQVFQVEDCRKNVANCGKVRGFQGAHLVFSSLRICLCCACVPPQVMPFTLL